MKKYFIFLLFGPLFVSGCATQKAWIYSPNDYNDYYDKPVNICKTAVVLPFQDSRENINKNRVMMYLIPLMPFGWQTLQAPEGIQMHIFSGMWTNYKPTEDFAKALAEEIKSANIFREAYFDFKSGCSDIHIQGKILTTEYRGKLISYGLSAYGPLLWLVGFPAGTVSNELVVELSLINSKSNEVIFSNTYTAPTYSKVGWIYVMPNGFNYPSMLKGIYKTFVEDIKTHIPTLSSKALEAENLRIGSK